MNINIIDAMSDPQLFAKWFSDKSWNTWKSYLKAVFGLPMDHTDLQHYRKHTGRTAVPEPSQDHGRLRYRRIFTIASRRAGKSLIATLIAVWIACFVDHSGRLQPGEVGTLMLLSVDRRSARTLMRYIRSFLEIPLLQPMVIGETATSVTIQREGNIIIMIEIHASHFKSVRGYSLIGAICDEVAFWHSAESSNPGAEVINALLPGLMTTQGPLIVISSPYSRSGILWDTFENYYGQEDKSVLVWRAATRDMNPLADSSLIAEALRDDPSAARAEWMGEFRDDLESYLPKKDLLALVVPNRRVLPPATAVKHYYAFVDMSGGRKDSAALCINHVHGGRVIIDHITERKSPFDPGEVVEHFSQVLQAYSIHEVTGDRYGGEWPVAEFNKHGIAYRTSEKSKSDIYSEVLPIFSSGRLELLDNSTLVDQLCRLERRTSRSGRYLVDHPPGCHDDLANATC